MLENYTNEIKLLQEWYERTKKTHVLFQSLVGYCVQLIDPEDINIYIK